MLVWIIFLGYSGCLIYWMFRGFGRSVHVEIRFNYVPFKTILHFITTMNSYNLKTPIINLAGNIGVFIPFGVILPYIFKRLRRLYLFSMYFISAILILELLQTFLKVGTGDIDDIIFNYIGGLIGYLVYRTLPEERKNKIKRMNNQAVGRRSRSSLP